MRRAMMALSLAMVCVPAAALADADGRAAAEAYIALDNCVDTQNAAGAAAQSEDKELTLTELDRAERTCRTAAAKLRAAPLDKIDTKLGADGIDQMAEGMAMMKEGLGMPDDRANEAKKQMKMGLLTYRYGLDKVKRSAR